ncbi:MAG: TIGR02281 family clan AA aspartic protease [Pseudomonadota bacterium]
MGETDFASLIYLSLFLVVIAGSYFVSQRKNLGQSARYAAIWGLIFLGAILAVGAWTEIRGVVEGRASVAQDGSEIVVPQAPDGHFYLTLEVNGTPIRFVIDTGATDIVLSRRDAERAGLDLAALIFSGRATTANGVVETAPVRLDTVGIGPVKDEDVRAVVNGGDLRESLLGVSYLSRFGSIEIAGGTLTLRR